MLSNEQIETFHEDGVLVLRNLLPGDCTAAFPGTLAEIHARIQDGRISRSNRFVVGPYPDALQTLYQNAVLTTLAQSLLASEDLALYINRILMKDKGWSGAVALHQDMPYFHGGVNKIALFVPLAPIKAFNGNGGLVFMRGSHRYGLLPSGTINTAAFPPLEEIGPDLMPGDVVAMNFLTWHYSPEATVPDERPLFQIVYQPATDGSCSDAFHGVPEPTLVTGQWRTDLFSHLDAPLVLRDKAY